MFSKNRLADMIAVGAIYIPILRREIRSYIETWNSHRIRKQKNRPNAIVGKPSMLYMCPPEGTDNYLQVLSHDELKKIKAETPEWDMHAVLPLPTQQWCDEQLRSMEFDPHTSHMKSAAEREAPYQDVYLELRGRIMQHLGCNMQPTLQLLDHPTGGWTFEAPKQDRGFDFAQDAEAEAEANFDGFQTN